MKLKIGEGYKIIMDHTSVLETDELMHLAIHASQNGRQDEAISLLKQLIEKERTNANAYYLLGALHAEIGMFDRAKEEMSEALEHDPSLVPARFQLGLLYLTTGRVDRASEIWAGLDSLEDDSCFFLFKRGLLSLVEDRFAACVDDLSKGIQLNTFNQALNNDMNRIIDDVRKLQTQTAQDDASNSEEKADDSSDNKLADKKYTVLSAYHRNDVDREH